MRLTAVTQAIKVGELTLKHSNLPERYVRRCMEVVYYKPPRPKLPQYREVTMKRIKRHFDVDRPWTFEFQELNAQSARTKIWVEPIKDWYIFKGDRVEILTGKDKGKHGIVVQIIQERNWVIVEGLNTYLTYIGKRKNFPGMLVRKEAPLLIPYEVSLVDPADLQPVKIEWRYTEKGEKVRVSLRTGRILPIPPLEEATYDYKTKRTYVEKDKDTKEKDATKITFEPVLKTFEMDIMDQMGIKEDREPVKSYWY